MVRSALAVAGLALAASARAGTDDADPMALLRSADADDRLFGISALVGQPASYLAPRRASLHAIVPKLVAKDPSPAVRGAAARLLARTEGDDALPHLLAALTNERDAVTERLLPEAFAELTGDAARRALAKAASDADDPRRGALAAEALGFLPKNAGFDDLVAVSDLPSHWVVAAGACLGLGRVIDVRVVPHLLPRLRHPDPAVRSAARESLVRLTGEDFGTDAAKWDAWWARSKDGFRFPDKAPELPTMRRGQTADRPMGDGDATFARFFGVELRRRRVAFVIDFSQSMWGARRAKAETELVAAVKGLPSSNTFAVVLFNERVWWFKDGPLPARPQEKYDLGLYLAEQTTKSYTNIYDSVEEALGLAGLGRAARTPAPGLDELVLLSDGLPNRGRITEPARILDAVRTLNGGRVVIDCVALGEEPGELLPALAKENGGTFVSCPFEK
jgi:HEAT repeat protein